MRHRFVLTRDQNTGSRYGWQRTHAVQPVSGTETELTAQLRRWALDIVTRQHCDDGRYFAYLVELDADGEYDTYFALSVEDIIWFYEREHVPVPASG